MGATVPPWSVVSEGHGHTKRGTQILVETFKNVLLNTRQRSGGDRWIDKDKAEREQPPECCFLNSIFVKRRILFIFTEGCVRERESEIIV